MKEVTLRFDESKIEFLKDLSAVVDKHGMGEINKEVMDSLLPITERVKTFEDACRVLNARCSKDGSDHVLVAAFEQIMNMWDAYSEDDKNDTMLNTQKHLIAYMKLCIITSALNEGWVPTFDEDEYRWFPWFRYYTKKEIAKMSDAEKQRKGLGLVGADANGGSRAGLGCVCSVHGWSDTSASVGSRLAYKSEALADYSGRQFREIWADYVGKFPKVDNFEEYEAAFGGE